jgi:hypothetical protein
MVDRSLVNLDGGERRADLMVEPAPAMRGSVGFALLALLCCGGAHDRLRDEIPPDPLPRAFQGVSWTTSPAELRSSFPTTDVSETAWTCLDGTKCVTWGTTVSEWPAFGPALVELSGRVGESARLITVYAVEPREACRDRAKGARPKDCLDEPGPALDGVFERMRKVLEAQLGRGERVRSYSSGAAHGFRPDPREHAVRWKRRGYAIELSLGANEDGWGVEVQAFRGW